MHNPYDLHTWSKDYRAGALREAQRRDLLARAHREPRWLRRLSLVWRNALAPPRGTRVAGGPSGS